VKVSRFFVLVALSFLFACSPLKPEIFTIPVPAGPLIHELEQHRQSFSSLKGLAHVEIKKQGQKRTFDIVAIVVDDQHRFRIEAYDPLGQSLMAVVWNGMDVLALLPDEDKVVRTESVGLQNLLGQGLEPSELCAVLSGNIPTLEETAITASQRCSPEGACILEIRDNRNNDVVRRIKVANGGSEHTAQNLQILTYELYRSNKLLFRTRFGRVEKILHYLLPMQIEIDNPDKNLVLTVVYNDVELNSPVNDEVFTLTDEPEDSTGK
jgi:outer membrane lipoprotein-sorting protein